MPIYEFSCDKCGRQFEELVRNSSDKARPVCPECGSRKVGKRFSTFGMGGGPSRSRPAAASSGSRGGCGGCSGGSCSTCH